MTVPIMRLHLDPKNYRHDPLESDAEVIAELCSSQSVAALAQDIAEMQSLSPLEVLGVIPMEGHKDHYIAVEGNRRTCALLLLHDPMRAPTAELQERFRRAAQNKKVPDTVKVHVFPNRKAAKPWIDRRHLGPQGGVGTLEWGADAKTRASDGNTMTTSRANTLALAALDRLQQAGLLDAATRKAVSLTTITRYLGTPGVRALLGLGDHRKLVYTHDEAEVDRALLRLVRDSIEPGDDGKLAVNSRSGTTERVNYARRLQTEGVAPTTTLPAPRAPLAPLPASKQAAKKRSAVNPAKLRKLFDTSFVVTIKDPILLRLREEALRVDLEEAPFSANYLLRAIVERVMVRFAKSAGRYSNSATDTQLTAACAKLLEEKGETGAPLRTLNKAAGNENHPFSLHSLGHTVHGGSVPSRSHLRAQADTWLPVLHAMLAHLK